ATATWIAVLNLTPGGTVAHTDALALLAPLTLDLCTVGLGIHVLHLRTTNRAPVLLAVLAWEVVLVGDLHEAVARIAAATPWPPAGPVALLVASALLGAAVLHPDGRQPATVVLNPPNRLSRLQVGLLVAAVVVGPAVIGLGLDVRGSTPLLVAVSAVLSLAVVAHLIRLVQGRAVLEHRAHHDELTGLPNRALFGDRTTAALAHARRAQTRSAVLFLDLDRFKTINDSLGHTTGNALLQAVARRLRTATRTQDTVARLGGDEFVVFLPHVVDAPEATDVARRILESFTEPFRVGHLQLFASPSIGIAVFPRDGEDAETLLKNADTAMYRAKQQGRRTYCEYSPEMNHDSPARLELESQLHTAIERGELRLHYQPKIHVASGRMTGMEALLRWDHPERGLLEPADFIALAEESGLIVPMGAWALEEACRQNRCWLDAGFPPMVVAVNLSARQFRDKGVESLTARVLRSTGLPPGLLELEVTESLAVQDAEAARATLLDLRAMGVACSIDDFGTGYSGLQHLTRFPVDKIKIDKSFVATIDADREAPIVVAVVAMAHGLGLGVVAEGVETAEQVERLRELGCDEMQGYLFSPPLPPARFEQLLVDAARGRGTAWDLRRRRLVRHPG
ncbi:MAG: putative bifunctional diguanylate cyclase/phosphodiesterase, partial [Acidimicrobiia bacterium]